MLEDDELLLQALRAYHPVDARLRLKLCEVCQERSYPRHYHLLYPGQVARYAWFLLSGTARVYYLHEGKGEEVTLWLWQAGDIVWALGSFCRRLPCRYHLQLLEDSRLLAVHYRDLERLAAEFENYRTLERTLTEACHARVLRHYDERARLSARERYARFMQQSPQLFHRVPVKDIATFLGLHPDTLSRLRAEK